MLAQCYSIFFRITSHRNNFSEFSETKRYFLGRVCTEIMKPLKNKYDFF